MNLYKKGTLHRDVSIHNVLFGKPAAKPGCRGVLIDLDMAIRYLTDGSNQTVNCRIVSSSVNSYLDCRLTRYPTGNPSLPVDSCPF
jgi:hypothetical protein